MTSLMEKGKYRPINHSFMTEGVAALQRLSEVQDKYGKGDIDNFLNELHDSMVGYYLGFQCINVEKHGFDCKYNMETPVFLESKVSSFAASSWGATFNDTTLEKALAFKEKNLWLALSVWQNAADLLFICYGQHRGIGEYLERRVRAFLDEHRGVRSTQTISMGALMRDYGFRILVTDKEPQKVASLIALKSPSLKKCVTLDRIDTLQTFREP
ncbi:MAG: hypothetical protein IKX21_00770, partial [Deltaproteobacteria bacterium]|nr:hypothetical protein [Deltaproteobacteria bacterium]